MVVHLLSFRRSVLGSTAAVFLDHASRDWGDVTVVLVQLRWTPRRFHIFHNCNRLFPFPSRHCSQDIAVWKNFRKIRRSLCCSCRRFIPSIICGTCWSSPSVSSPEWTILHSCGSRTSRSTSWPCSRVLYSAARLQKEVLQVFCDPRCCYRFPRNFSNRLMVPKMILRLGFVDLDHIASSILPRLVALSELSEPSGRAHPEFSYIPFSHCALQAVCCSERLHVTVFSKNCSLSLGRASNYTKIHYFENVSKYSCMARSLVSWDRMEFHPCHIRPPSGSL